jgi:4-hydroxy-3-methylbut-2-enyl diphosphate reductase
LQIIRAENAGFCFGVKRAMKMAFEAAAENDKNIYSLGPIIHNPQAVEVLTQKGVEVLSDLDSLSPGDTLIIRSHGTCPEILEKATTKKLKVVNATCPFVLKAQKLAKQLASEGYQVVVVGESHHPEVMGIMGFAGTEARVVDKADDVEHLPESRRIGVVAQTTQSFDNFRDIVGKILDKSDELKVFNTICHATACRQEAALQLAREVDIMIVIGGHNSANTNRLAYLCRETGVPTYHIEVDADIQDIWFEGVDKIGITAGASTPEWIIGKVIKRLEVLGAKNS